MLIQPSRLCMCVRMYVCCYFQEFKFLRKRNENLNLENVSIGSENSDDGKRSKGYFTGKRCPFDVQVDEEEHEDVLETNGVRLASLSSVLTG